jgi:dihydrofolate reductase
LSGGNGKVHMKRIIISAIAANGVIGDSQKGLPWHIPEEFKHFKETTLGFPLIMGKKTFLELGKPLKGRLNIVLSTDPSFSFDDPLVKVCSGLQEALDYCELSGAEKVFIAGGRSVYAKAILLCDEMILSFLKQSAEGDVYFPKVDLYDWRIVHQIEHELFTVKYYEKR